MAVTILDDPGLQSSAGVPPLPTPPRGGGGTIGFWPRIAIVMTFAVMAYGPVYLAVITDAIGGSRTAYLLVMPVLSTILADRYRNAPRGVGDSESDWIVAIVVGVGGYAVIRLMSHRLPAVADLWHLDLLAVVLWVACSTAIVFGVRSSARMAGLWIFAAFCATPMPYLLITARLGGSDTAAELLAAGVAAAVVFWSAKATAMTWRILVSAACLAIATAAVFALRGTDLLLTVTIAAGVIPAIHAIALHHFSVATNRQRGMRPPDRCARRSWVSFAALAAVACGLLVDNLHVVHRADFPTAQTDWIERSQPATPTQFTFIARFLGPGSTFTRYAVAPVAGLPDAAVDVISTTNAGALHDFSDAPWYPTGAPVSPRVADVGVSTPVAISAVHSNADAAASGDVPDWYGLRWEWRSANLFQQVTVVVSQSNGQVPPEPRPLTLASTLIQPALWMARQQPDSIGIVDDAVVRRADDIARHVIALGSPHA